MISLAKKIKFPLEMKDGVMVRTLEELRANFDVEKIYQHWMSGKLRIWLMDRHYNNQLEELDKIKQLNIESLPKLCKILAVDMDVTRENLHEDIIARRYELTKQLRQFTCDKEILENTDVVATNQSEFDKLIRNDNCKVIYLFGKIFTIDASAKDKKLVGVNEPILQVESDEMIDFSMNSIQIENCIFDNRYNAIVAEYKAIEENKRNNQQYVPSVLFDYLLSDADKKKSKLLYDIIKNGEFEERYNVDIVNEELYSYLQVADILHNYDVEMAGEGIKEILQNSEMVDAFDKFIYQSEREG